MPIVQKERVTWIAAFAQLWRGEVKVLRLNPLVSAFMTTLLAIAFSLSIGLDFSGERPPIAPAIKVVGTLKAVFLPGRAGGWSVVFTTNDEKKINMSPLSVPPCESECNFNPP